MIIVKGQVKGSDGTALASVSVRVFVKSLRQERELVETTTDQAGHFTVQSESPGLPDNRRLALTLIVRAYSGRGAKLAEARKRYATESEYTIDLEVPAPAEPAPGTDTGVEQGAETEYETILRAVVPLTDGIPLGELQDDEIAELSQGAEIDESKLNALALAHREAERYRMSPQVLFVLAKAGLVTGEHDLSLADIPRSMQALQAALGDGVARIDEALLATTKRRFEMLRFRSELIKRNAERPEQLVVNVVDDQSGEPLPEYLVHLIEGETKILGVGITDRSGVAYVQYSPFGRGEERSVRLEVMREGTEGVPVVEPVEMGDEPIEVRLPRADNDPLKMVRLGEIKETLGRRLSPALRSIIDRVAGFNLADVIKAGGFEKLVTEQGAGEDSRIEGFKGLAQRMNAHANLALLDTEPAINEKLIDADFWDITGLARTPRAEVLRRTKGMGGKRLQKLHDNATAQTGLLSQKYLEERLKAHNGYDETPASRRELKKACEACEDCDSAVSPLAYLADLLDYTSDHVFLDDAGLSATPERLQQKYHQFFADLPVSCDEMDRNVRQARIAVEVLRRHLRAKRRPANNSAADERLETASKSYVRNIYEALLIKLGVSLDELRLGMQDADSGNRSAVAERIGIPPDSVSELYIEPEALSEQVLEVVFGLIDTQLLRDPLSNGVVLGDQQGLMSRWQLETLDTDDATPLIPLEWNRQTDAEGFVHVVTDKINDDEFGAKLYRDARRGPESLLAMGNTKAQTLVLKPRNDSDLGARISIDHQRWDNTSDIRISLVPRLLSWRLQSLRDTWVRQDWPEQSSEFTGVVIDPDIIGPDDFRNPLPKAKADWSDAPFDIWLRRRRWVDHALEIVKDKLGDAPDKDKFNILFEEPVSNDEIEGIAPWDNGIDFDQVIDELRNVEQSKDKDALLAFEEKIRLPVVSIQRLVEIWNTGLTEAEWRQDDRDDLVSIAVQAQKMALGDVWRLEEQVQDIDISSEHFWRALKEPKEGVWPPARNEHVPFVDPDAVSLKELPEITAGSKAQKLWMERSKSLEEQLQAFISLRIETERSGATADEVLNELLHKSVKDGCNSLDNDASTDCLAKLFDLNQQMLVDPDGAKEKLSTIGLDAETFSRFMNLVSRYDPQTPGKLLNEQEWRDLLDIFLQLWKYNSAYTDWSGAEEGIDDWSVVKARLPKWRANYDARRAWTRALDIASQTPIIDPDQVPDVFFRKSTGGGREALRLREERAGWLKDLVDNPVRVLVADDASEDGEQPQRDEPTRNLDYFHQILVGGLFSEQRWASVYAQSISELQGGEQASREQIVTLSMDQLVNEFTSLVAARDAGETISGRLQQLGLTHKSFNYLADKRAVLAGSGGDGDLLGDTEWRSVYEILSQSWKIREFSAWRKAERERGISLNSDIFRIPAQFTGMVQDNEAGPLSAWRTSYTEYLDWKDTLQARIDQQKDLVLAYWRMISEVEGEMLPALRDALIEASIEDKDDTELETQRQLLSDELLVDLTESGCQVTTRVGQAISTMHALLQGLDSGRIKQDATGLRLVADDYDADWKWLGSYATWRAAMFVYLYPENVLIPSLRRHQTPAFRALMEGLRSRRLTPDAACELARDYEAYYKDIINLRLEASCYGRVMTYEGSPCQSTAAIERRLLFLFGKGPATGQIYWSAIDPEQDNSDYQQRFWEVVPGLEKAQDIIGVQPYTISEEQRYIYLFVKQKESGTSKLCFIRYDLAEGRWNEELQDLPTPKDEEDFTALVVQQWDYRRPPHLIIRIPDGGIYDPSLKREGMDWGPFTSSNIQLQTSEEWIPLVHLWKGRSFRSIEAAMAFEKDEFILLVRDKNNDLSYRLFGPRDDGGWQTLIDDMPNMPFRGIMRLPQNNGFRVFMGYGNTEVSFGKNVVRTYVWSLYDVVEPLDKSQVFYAFNRWLEHRIELSLNRSRQWITRKEEDYKTIWVPNFSGMQEPVIKKTIKYQEDWISHLDLFSSTEKDIDNFKGEIDAAIKYFKEQIEIDGGPWQYADGLLRQFNNNSKDLATWLHDIAKHLIAYSTLSRVEDTITYTWNVFGNHRIVSCVADTLDPSFVPYQLMNRDSEKTGAEIFIGQLKQQERLGQQEYIFIGKSRLAPKDTWPPDVYSNWLTQGPGSQIFEARTAHTRSVYLANVHEGLANRSCIEEAYYFMPLAIAQKLQQRGHYAQALDWYRLVYDYTVKESPKIYYGLVDEEVGEFDFDREEEWLRDPLNPHAVAGKRQNTYTRYTMMSIAGCLLGYADAEFTIDTMESVPRARSLYVAAQELLSSAALGQGKELCESDFAQKIAELKVIINDRVPKKLQAKAERLSEELAAANDANSVASVIDHLRSLSTGLDTSDEQWGVALTEESASVDTRILFSKFGEKLAEKVPGGGSINAAVMGVIQAGTDLGTVSARMGVRGEKLQKSLRSREPIRMPAPVFSFCITRNPIIDALRMRARINLHKIANCQNIAGMRRELDKYASATDQSTGMPYIGAAGQLVLPGINNVRPTPYKFAYLLDRAKQLVGLAQQMENTMLAALQQRDVEAVNILNARQHVRVSRSQVRLQDIRVKEAADGVGLASLQQERARLNLQYYEGLIDEGFLDMEEVAIGFLLAAATSSYTAAAINLIPWKDKAAGFNSLAGALSTTAQIIQYYAQHHRREQEWRHQMTLSTQDIRIGAQQVKLAKDRVRIVSQEKTISVIQSEHAKDTAEFLANKFTNKELYEWMSGILESVYGGFLELATAAAKTAEYQLAFERQESPAGFIQEDYWNAPSEDAFLGDTGKTPERRGLTGSARLLFDIHQLDQHAVDTNQRKQPLTETISLAQLDPFAFQQFKERGVMRFATGLEMFDRHYAGHYLRLIKRVRMSVFALAPANQNLHYTLSCLGTSRVVTGRDMLQKITVHRAPETVAYSAAQNATGVFELDPNPEMRLPFEGLGVETSWELRMPKMANVFDYNTIADIFITMEYTALHSETYKEEVLRSLNPRLRLRRPFSFKHQFADQWFDLRNPEQSATPMKVTFKTVLTDFAPNVDKNTLVIDNVGLYFSRADGKSFEAQVESFQFTMEGENTPVGGAAGTVEGSINTKQSSGSAWMPMQGSRPVGVWDLTLPNTEQVRNWFKGEEVTDILFVIDYSGRTLAII